MHAMPSGFGLESVSFFVICLFLHRALHLLFWASDGGAVGNAAELPGWLARVHDVLIDMFDTLFFLHDKLLCK
ncbi:hypothetical protein ACN38_g326 [Penicillium nordicum]|uniref:Uncharacterized protein n=1 Tax=Penicillium nordicum TaxID=229535 RepID=A0A0M9WKS2_9EURO|nr:hypothetical protein ACN38_g326 [Penicillium nordicum]